MSDSDEAERAGTIRIDRLLVYLRFARTRSVARKMVESGHMRMNGERIVKSSREAAVGDVLTLMRGDEVIVARIDALPERRLSPAKAASSWTRIA